MDATWRPQRRRPKVPRSALLTRPASGRAEHGSANRGDPTVEHLDALLNRREALLEAHPDDVIAEYPTHELRVGETVLVRLFLDRIPHVVLHPHRPNPQSAGRLQTGPGSHHDAVIDSDRYADGDEPAERRPRRRGRGRLLIVASSISECSGTSRPLASRSSVS